MEEAFPHWTETVNEFAAAIAEIGEITGRATEEMERSDAGGKGFFAGRLRVSKTLARDLSEPAGRLEAAGQSFAADLVEVDAGVLTLIRMAEEGLAPDDVAAVCEFFDQIKGLANGYQTSAGQLSDFSRTMQETGRLSRDLRAPFAKIQDGLRGYLDGQGIVEEWVQRIDTIGLPCSQGDPGSGA